eukprot:3644561-Alexandrium_andersonii.AAC.1
MRGPPAQPAAVGERACNTVRCAALGQGSIERSPCRPAEPPSPCAGASIDLSGPRAHSMRPAR